MVSRSARPSLVFVGCLLAVAALPGAVRAQSPADAVAQLQAESRVLRKEIRKLRSDLHRAQADLDRSQVERNSLAVRSSEEEQVIHTVRGRVTRLEWGLGIAILIGLAALALRGGSSRREPSASAVSPRELDPLRAGIRALDGRLSAVEQGEPASRVGRAGG
jgi:hypothetical protein